MAMTLIFDMDGTLFQTDTILELSLQETFDHLGSLGLWAGQTPIETYRKIMGVPLPVVWETLLPNHSDEIRLKANDFFLEKLLANIQAGKGALYPNVEAVFSELQKNGCSLFIASNGLVDYLSAIVGYYRLDRWITETFSIQQIETQDKADLVRSIVTKYAIKKAAVIGDRISDIRAAKMNGLLSIGCNFDFAQEDELAHADIVIDDLLQLTEIVSQQISRG